ncbi:hypothetical protein G9A89_001345 [Geosiphon pyriformis]|nr:hypothetical protein G9A89_001345 [Geosiphon pyriformis]
MPEEQDFHHIVLSEARIAENANLSLLSSKQITTNEQKAITAMYTEAEVKGKTICLILDSGSTRSIITYQLMQQLKRNVDQPVQTVIVTVNDMKKTLIGEIDNFLFTLDGFIIPVKVLVMDVPQYQTLTEKPKNYNSFIKDNMPEYPLLVEEEKPVVKTFMALKSTFNWNIPYSKPEPKKQHPYILLKYKDCHKKLFLMGACISPEEEYENHTCYYYTLPEEYNWIDVAMKGEVCNQTCQYALSISEKVKRETPFNAAYNSAFNKLYHYLYDAEMIFDLAMALVNEATKEDVHQMKKAKYIKYILESARYDYEDEVKVYHQIASHTYPTKEPQAQQLEQMNIKLCEEYIMPCDKQWCSECYALSISLLSKNDKNEIEFEEPKATEKIETTPIYLIKNQPALQLKYFNNNRQRIKPEKAHKIDAGYDLKYLNKDALVLKSKFLTKINLKIALEILSGAMVQIASQSSLASKGINVRGGIIDARYTGDITVILQNKTDKPFKIKHAEKIAQAIYLPLINISDLQLVN